MQFALLGDIQFEVVTYLDGLESKFGTDYAEHARIEGKPRLQWIGSKLDEMTFKLKFHSIYCNPEFELARLRDAMDAHIPLPFVLGTGEYKGDFVITDMSQTLEQTDPQGAIVAVEASLNLREHIGALGKAKRPAGIAVAGQPYHPVARSVGLGQARPNLPATKLQEVVAAGREFSAAFNAVSRTVDIAKRLQNNPLLAIEELAKSTSGFSRIVTAANRMGVNLAPLQSVIVGTAPLVAMSAAVGQQAVIAVGLLNGLSTANIGNRMDSIHGSLGIIGNHLTNNAAALAKLSARAAVREAI